MSINTRRAAAAAASIAVGLGLLAASSPAAAQVLLERAPTTASVTVSVDVAPEATWSTGALVGVRFVPKTGGTGGWFSWTVRQNDAPFTAELAPGEYAVVVDYRDYRGDDTTTGGRPLLITAVAGESLSIEPQLLPEATVSGTISSAHGIPDRILPTFIDPAFAGYPIQHDLHARIDATTGRYTVSDLPPGRYDFALTAERERWLPEWWKDSPTREGATPVDIATGQALTGYDVELTNRPAIDGTVTTTDATGAIVPAEGVTVTLDPDGDSSDVTTVTDAAGRYEILVDTPGRYDVSFGNDAGQLDPIPDSRNWVRVELGSRDFQDGIVYAGTDVTVERAGSIEGRITVWDGRSDARVVVNAERRDPVTGEWTNFPSGPTGWNYRLAGLPAGDYRVRFVQAHNQDNHDEYRSEYFDDELYPQDARLVTVRAAETTTGVDARMEARSYSMFRIGGADRYAVSAAASKSTFEPGVPVVYLASGENFPDALSAGPAAAHRGGSLLLTARATLPAATRSELERLRPQRIVVVGGPAAISSEVAAQLAGLAPSIQRIGGADRYEVSRKVVADAFCGRVDATSCPAIGAAFVATGSSYPDALSAGPAAAHLGGPVLLVNGSATEPDAQTAALIGRLGLEKVYIAGGQAAVGAPIESWLQRRVGSVERIAGLERFDTSMNIAWRVWGHAEAVYFASGENFPDALSGGAVAPRSDAPVMLVRRTCIPDTTRQVIDILNPIDITLLGGPTALADGVYRYSSFCPQED
ncbi:cell wall-binding repeat-containing protein [Herbiconiux sp. VKM Ac-2851]|uniref:cell wall-binding repeat-containing protein n=1 Tax=Herbiconiux sp. VKM Ac-2851 TaxID=2739025 RepID=UPI0015651299|nr:cell wall-binding repeat-containing protein [Herbiconiux sp. VKM Ac-2851]NQX33252.1 cell wall-binding repeat-containing protein [Herbiconiux sp. VKM Ac-2851]